MALRAHEAGAVYFIDRALVTFSSDDQKPIVKAFPKFKSACAKLVSCQPPFSSIATRKQEAVLESSTSRAKAAVQRPQRARYRPGGKRAALFEFFASTSYRRLSHRSRADRKGNAAVLAGQ